MGLQRGIDDNEPVRPIGDEVSHEEHRVARTGVVAVGTRAGPSGVAPVALGESRVKPSDVLACPFCDHHGFARDFLSLEPPVRPMRVAVRITMPRVAPALR
jgi:hypothetical protein